MCPRKILKFTRSSFLTISTSTSHLLHGNNKEYLTHIVAVLHVIRQRGLDSQCRKLKKAVLRQSEILKNLLEAAGSRDTVLMDVDITAHKVEIDQTQQLLQDF
jgi:hypothetical protein